MRKRNEKIVTAYKLAVVMLGINRAPAAAQPVSLTEDETISNSRNNGVLTEELPEPGKQVERGRVLNTLLQKRVSVFRVAWSLTRF